MVNAEGRWAFSMVMVTIKASLVVGDEINVDTSELSSTLLLH